MTSFHVLALISVLYSLQVDAFGLRSLVENPFLPAPVHRHLLSCTTEVGVDYLGNDLKSVPGAKASDCCTLCSQAAGCGAFTWTSYSGGTCWLKSSKGNTASNPAASSAVVVPDQPSCSIKDNTDYQGYDIANVMSSNAGSCCSICENWPNCNAFTWSNHNGGTCWLKSQKGAEVQKAGVKSAPVTNKVGKCQLQYDTDFVDNDIGNTPGKTPGDCCGICYNWSGCRSFSWSNLNGGTCWLKSAMGQVGKKTGVVSSQLLDNPPPRCDLEANVDYNNNDLSNVPGPNPNSCCQPCRQTVGCHAFSWSNHNGGTCWLKTGKGATTTKNGVTSAVVF
ncbi:hypothetical protein DVH05_026280 [Phytophthora capsici]|nr:hypothetical protein DVH05_026280 [Phytophthora capsici]|eukprot:jgi/Phyca11/505850/fgenesh2_kg.PHYCAscaffold_16_\